ncbi:MAG: phosphoenolpyruvate carboxykinase (ATP) [Bacteroidota bacterium]
MQQLTNTQCKEKIASLLKDEDKIKANLSRPSIIQEVVQRREAIVSESGALATWTPRESTGRSPKDTVIVKRPVSQDTIDWDSPNNLPVDEETFDMVFEDAYNLMAQKEKIYVTDRVVGADPHFSLPVKTITDHALTSLFTGNMFRPVPENIEESVFHNKEFTLLSLPYNKLDPDKYKGRLRTLEDGTTTDMIVVMDFDRRIGIIVGSAYLGSVKKMLFTVMNYYLPFEGVLPLHCSANEGKDGESALLLGLSGTGKTTLSADPSRALLGDDEHGWSDNGIANFENGCYAKMIDIDPDKEPEIYNAVMHKNNYLQHGAIVENAMIYPNGVFDFCDDRFTPNSRASYLLDYLHNIKKSSTSGHPSTILFLTADAYGVLPPVSRLNSDQAMLWFLMGYTSKLAGTETGITEPQATFSRFFGQPFMPRNPGVYADMLGEKLEEYNSRVYLINTGWTGGPYGKGERIDINYTRKMVDAALNGDLEDKEFRHNELFHLNVPLECPGVPNKILSPRDTWSNNEDYEKQAQKLAKEFSDAYDKSYGNKNIRESVTQQCPGK